MIMSSGNKNTLFLAAVFAVVALAFLGLSFASDDSDAASVANGAVLSEDQSVGTWDLDDAGVLSVVSTIPDSDYASVTLDGIGAYYASVKIVKISGFTKDLTSLFSRGIYTSLTNLYYVGSWDSPRSMDWTYDPSTWTLTVDTKQGDLYFSKPEHSDTPILPWSEYFFYTQFQHAVVTGTATTLGSYVFWGCTSLTTLTSDTITKINGTWTLKDTNISEVNMPNLATIEYFQWSPIVSTDSSDKYISCFTGTNVQIMNTPKLSYIGNNAFRDRTSLTDLKLNASSVKIHYSALRGCTALKDLDVSGITYLDRNVFTDCGLTGTFVFSNLTSVVTWGESPFYSWAGLTGVEIPSLAKSDVSLFKNCVNLRSVVLSDELATFAGSSFYGCTSLVSVEFPDTLTTISNNMFRDCTALKSVVIGNKVTTIDYSAFQGCTVLSSVTQREGTYRERVHTRFVCIPWLPSVHRGELRQSRHRTHRQDQQLCLPELYQSAYGEHRRWCDGTRRTRVPRLQFSHHGHLWNRFGEDIQHIPFAGEPHHSHLLRGDKGHRKQHVLRMLFSC